MKILHIVQSLRFGGIEKLVLSIMQNNTQDVYILAIEGSFEECLLDSPALANFQGNLFFANKKKGLQKAVIDKIISICLERSITVLHTHHIGPLIYGSLAGYKLKKIHHIHTQHDAWHLQVWKNWFMQWILLKCNKKIQLVAVSHDVGALLHSYFPQKHITVIHNGVDINRFKPGDNQAARDYFKLPHSAVIIGNAGRLEPVKGQKYLIEAMVELPPNFYLLIAGNGTLYPELLKQIHHLNLSNRVILLHTIEEIVLFYQACDLFCLSSLNEGLPLSILEAQSCNIPVVCTKVGGCSEGVDPDSGVLIPAMNPQKIAESCFALQQRKSAPRAFIIKNFAFEPMLQKYQQLYAKQC